MTASEWVQQLQGERSQSEFAKQIGYSQSSLSKFYLGKRRFGPALARKLMQAYPELAFVIAGFLLAADRTESHSEAA